MRITTSPISALPEAGTDLLVVPVQGDGETIVCPPLSADLNTWIADGAIRSDIRSKEGRSTLAYAPEGVGPRRVLFMGVGERVTDEGVRAFAGRAVRVAEELELTALAIRVPSGTSEGSGAFIRAVAEGAVLAAWRFTELFSEHGSAARSHTPAPVTDVTLFVPEEAVPKASAAAAEGVALGSGENLARTLQERPGNVATPTHLAETARSMCAEYGLDIEVLGPNEMAAERMGALLAVAQGSSEEPRLIVMHHRGGAEGSPPVALVGKGLTFDAGGISIKPSKGMEDMKYDMSAGAAVIGAMQAIAEMKLPINVVGVVPSSENLINGSALKPGDVITTRSGKTVEVTNTDAEGRLILSDALNYVQSYEPAAIVDCATLTGAVVIGLGHHAIAVLGTDDGLVEEIQAAGERTGERCWPLPLWDGYAKQLKSEVADLNNVGGRPAGTITAACFLREFVGDIPWAHLDIAGTAYGTEPTPYRRKGAYGVPTRLLVDWVRSRAE